MKKIKEITGFDELYVYDNSIIVENKKSIQQIDNNLNLFPLVEGDIYMVTILGDDLFYQIENSHNIYIYKKDIVLKDDFSYALISALKCDIYIYISSKRYDASIFLDSNLGFVGKAPRYCNFSYKQYLILNDNLRKNFICYKLYDKLWEYKHTDDSNIQIISGYKDKVLIYSENGDLFTLNLNNGELCWKYPEQCPYSRYGFFDNYIYHIYKNEFREISADTGKICRVMDIRDLREKEHFFATAGIKIYDEYVFCRDVDGAVAIIDRKTLVLKEILHFEKHLINWEHSLHWVNNRLYVQDTEYVIHIFE